MKREKLEIDQVNLDDFMVILDKIICQAIENSAIGLNAKSDEDELLTRDQTSKKLNVSLATLYNWQKQGILIPKKLGKRVYYPKQEVLSKLKIAS